MAIPRFSRAALLVAFAACATAPRRAPEAPVPAAVPDEAAVYAAVIDHLARAGGVAVVIDSTLTPASGALKNVLREADAEFARDFRVANQAARPVPRPLPTARTIRFARRGELPFATAGANRDLEALWAKFGAQFPGANGYYEFSGIGFDASRSGALVYVGHSCGSLCGEGQMVTLRRAATGWRVANARTLWVS